MSIKEQTGNFALAASLNFRTCILVTVVGDQLVHCKIFGCYTCMFGYKEMLNTCILCNDSIQFYPCLDQLKQLECIKNYLIFYWT